MKTFILAVLLTVMQATPPVPWQTPDSPTRTGKKIKAQGKTNQAPALPSPSTVETNINRPAGGYNSQENHKNTEYSVVISKLPAVAVATPKRDWADWGTWGFNLLLVAVGALQVWLLCWTLRVSRIQAHEMKRQRSYMRLQWKGMGEQAQLMEGQLKTMINSERAWVMVDIEWQKGAHIINSTTDTGIYVEYICRNRGKSFAQITEKRYVLNIVPFPLPQEPDFSLIDNFHHACEYVAPGTATEPYLLSGIACLGHRDSKNTMVIYGRVKYTDVYGVHETRFGYMITPMGHLDRLPASSYPKYNEHT